MESKPQIAAACGRIHPNTPNEPLISAQIAEGSGTGVCSTKPESPTLLAAERPNATVTLMRLY